MVQAQARQEFRSELEDRGAVAGGFNDIRDFLELLEAAGELRRFSEVSAHLDIGTITEVLAEEGGPAALFERIPGYDANYRVMSNSFGTLGRTGRLLRIDPNLGGVGMVNAWREKLRTYQGIPPREVSWGPVMQNQQRGAEVDLEQFPTPMWHADDGGRYLGTGCCVITRDPDSGVVNLGTYRVQLQAGNMATILINKGKGGRMNVEKYHARGQRCPVAISLGQDPTLFLSSFSPVPAGQSEYDYAGWIRQRPVEVVRGPITGLPLPATGEIVLEGEILLPEDWKRLGFTEGPFGEWPGYYTESSTGGCPVMEVQAVYYRDAPVLLGSPPMAPPATHLLAVPIASANLWDQLEKAGIPGVTGVWGHVSSGQTGFFTVVAIKQMYAGHAKQTALVAAGARAAAYGGRFVVVVDDDVDVGNLREVVWAMSTRCDVGASIDIVRDVWTSPVDPIISPEKREARNFVTDRALIIATRPYTWKDDFPTVCAAPRDVKRAAKEKWGL
jgi:4-hydroxy-3-polyprenylbenzoate decarboxylase